MEDEKRRRGPHKGGGHVTLARHGREHFASAGRKGGQALRDAYGPQRLALWGKAGGEHTRDRHGREHFVEAGRKGGLKNRGRKRGPQPQLQGPRAARVPEATLSDLRARIEASGLTQVELAARLGITQPMLSSMLSGRRHTCASLGGDDWPGRVETLLQTIADKG